MDADLVELEKEFRDSWRNYDPTRYAAYLSRAGNENRVELLARLLGVELEYSFQPPFPDDESQTVKLSEDEERVRPSMQLFVLRFPELCDHQEILIRLSVLEYALRLRHDRIPPNPDSYLWLCKHSPDRLIKLLRLTENRLPSARSDAPANAAEPSDSTVKDAQVSVSVTVDPLPHNLGCFLLIKMIGKGGMGYVHSAIDLRSTAQIAVKVMRRIDPWSVYRFIEEFTWLSQLSHPNLVKLYDAFADGDVRYFSMELVEGKTIRDWFRAVSQRELPSQWSQLRRVLAQAASAIDFLHRHSAIHCDIKCSNLMITSRRRAVLLDLGLAIREGNSQPMVGTLQYMAPEVLEGAKPTRQSDWYSFGMLIFEVLTDTYPPIEVDLSAKQGEEKYRMNREKLAEQLADCDAELSELCRHLLNPDPALRPTGTVVLRRLGRTVEHPEFNSTSPTVLGRKTVVKQLALAYRESFARPRIALVSGEPGIGKSTVVDYWLEQLDGREPNELILRLRCFRQDHTPLRLFNSLVQELVQALQQLPESDWRTTLSPRIKEIGDAFPQVLQLVENDLAVTSRPKSATPNYLLRSRGVQSLEEWLVELCQSRRMLLVVDDAQWADEESMQVIVGLVGSQQFRGFVVAIDEHGTTRINRLMHQILPIDASLSNDSWLSTIQLGPLTEAASIEILMNLGTEQATDITPGIAASIAQSRRQPVSPARTISRLLPLCETRGALGRSMVASGFSKRCPAAIQYAPHPIRECTSIPGRRWSIHRISPTANGLTDSPT